MLAFNRWQERRIAGILIEMAEGKPRAITPDTTVRKGRKVSKVPEVLFVCVHNAGRSVAASVLMDHYANGKVKVSSAGSDPGKEINPHVAQILEEKGLDFTREFPKPLTDAAQQQADIVITMGCGDACTFYPGKRYIDWDLEDPAGKPIEVVREIVAEIEARVVALLAEIAALA